MTEYRRSPLHGAERIANAARQVAQLPWFLRNVTYKVLVTARLRPLAIRLGMDPTQDWPY
jgi:hypothetical protein